MFIKVKFAVISLITLMTFPFVADEIVWATQTWECHCTNHECEWCTNNEDEWSEYHALATAEYEDMFTNMFNSYETKWTKNNRLMIRSGNTGSFKFVKKG